MALAGGIVLAGGRSRRMGRPKAMLPFGPEMLLQRIVRLLGEAVGPIVVVAAEGQELPPLADDVRIERDRRPDRGPLEGIAVGLRALEATVGAAFVTACDTPLLRPELVRRVIGLLAGFDAAVPWIDGRAEPLAAAYRPSVVPHAEALLSADRLRPIGLFDRVPTRRISREDLADVDPELESLEGMNTSAQYGAALHQAGFDVSCNGAD